MIYRTYLLLVIAEFFVKASDESPPATSNQPKRSLVSSIFLMLKKNPEIRNILTALLFGVGVFLLIMNLLKLTGPDEIDTATSDVKNELQLLGPFKLVKCNGGKEVLSSE